MDLPDYFEYGFDPTSVTVPRLRGILLEQDVDYNGVTRKADLVSLFNQYVAPKASSARRKSTAKPSTTGIVNAGDPPAPATTPKRRAASRGRKSAAPVVDSTDEAEEERPAKTPRARKSTATARKSAPTPATRRSTRSATVERQTEELENEENELPKPSTTRKSRKSFARLSDALAATPGREVDDDEGVFSPHNPFQKSKSRSPEYGQKSTGRTGSAGKRKSIRRTIKAEPESEEESFFTKSNNHVLRRMDEMDGLRDSPSEDDPLAPSEEFAPEEALEVAQEDERAGPVVRGNRTYTPPAGAMNALWVIAGALLVFYLIWLRKEKIAIGYCGVARMEAPAEDLDNPWLEWLRPQCEPCPPHASCYPGMELECENDYVKVTSPLAINGVFPISPRCEPDTEKLRKIRVFSDEAVRILRENTAAQRCRDNVLKSDVDIEGLTEQDLRQVLYNRKSPSMSDREFSDIWRVALDDVENRDEIELYDGHNGTQTYIRSHSLASLPLSCALRHQIVGSLARNSRELTGLVLLFISFLKARRVLAWRRTKRTLVKSYITLSLERLAKHAARHPDSPGIAVSHLRDQVLQHEFDHNKRKELWEGVEKVVELNTNVRSGEKEIAGEYMRVWTWIGGAVLDGEGVDEPRRIEKEEVEAEVVPERKIYY